ncbi:MAG: DEAD/DEAH box helicase [Nitrospiraceae bacterium]|nr:DEAD/DEAH box helicase [Nitrospiraceae bacterium]
MGLTELIESLDNNKKFTSQIAEQKHIPPVLPRYSRLDIDDDLKTMFTSQGIERFWSHQIEAIDLIRQGENVVVMTPTASGKSLIYNIPVIESIKENPGTKALYIFPLKGLEQDQMKNLNELFNNLGIKNTNTKSSKSPIKCAEVYDGDTTQYRRKKIRQNLPNVIFTNPDMIHLAINPFHVKWEKFFKNLKYIVIDEIHTYRGVFGSNVAHVLRRLRRICDYWGSYPQFIACSATIANPKELAEELTGLNFKTVTESGAPQAGKYFTFINPIDSPYTEATRLFIECIKAGLKTIVFTKARKITELIYRWTIDKVPELASKISPYRAGFLPKERREIEHKLFSGELLGVISTSALELGVDIGGLDACILVGYPGSISSTWQRAGRTGRQGQESFIVMIAMQDALDQYFMRHPEAFFDKSHEACVIDPENKNILKKHLPCASSEIYLKQDDKIYDIKKLRPLINEMVEENILKQGKKAEIWFSKIRTPQREVEIRTIGKAYDIIDESGKTIGELSGSRVFREAFPGAAYLHWGKQYLITNLMIEQKKAVCRESDLSYYTQALTKEETSVLAEIERKNLNKLELCRGMLRMKSRVTGYDKKSLFDRTVISREKLEMPEYIFETEGLWIKIDERIRDEIESHGYDLAGTLHAVEHLAITCMPLFALCDKGDIGGLSYPLYPEFRTPAIFIFDGYEGGVGLTKRAYDVADEWLSKSLEIINECNCENGCPSCIQDPQCGSGNQPLDKQGARFLLEKWLGAH